MLFCLLEGVVWCVFGVVLLARRCCLVCQEVLFDVVLFCLLELFGQEVLFGCLGLLEVVGWSVCVRSLLFGDVLFVW